MSENITTSTPNEDTKYIKRIDDLIEEAEIEAELEAEKKIRSKNTKLLTISILGCAMLLFLYSSMNNGTEINSAEVQEPEAAITEINVPIAEPLLVQEPATAKSSQAKENPVAEPAQPKPPKIKKKPTLAPAPKPAQAAKRVKKKQPKPVAEVARVPVQSKKAPANAATGKQYFVQLGVFSVEDNANKLAKKLQNAGFTPSVTASHKSVARHVVSVGKFADKADAQTMSRDLASKGYQPKLTRMDDGAYTLNVGSFKSAEKALDFQGELSLKGFLSMSEGVVQPLTLYTVTLGAYSSSDGAKAAEAKLDRKGFKKHFTR